MTMGEPGKDDPFAPVGTARDSLLAKYRIERDKRLRPDGNDQYIEPTGRFSQFLGDPYTEVVSRDPILEEVEVVVIGGGFGGLVTGARLKQAGVADVRIIEAGGDVGGAWYWNRYPGAMCDTAAMVYLPLLEETGHMPSSKYVEAPEILGQAQRIARHFDLYQGALFSTEVTSLTWDGTAQRWMVATDRGDRLRARYVAMGTGPLNRPKLPGIPGIDTFDGHTFHTSRWDYTYTGGDGAGAPMTGLADKRVGIIGTGATAVQCIPHLGRDAGELFVFQRTPSSIDVRNNHPIDPAWFATLEPGWQGKWLTNFATLQSLGYADEDLVMDGWTDISQRIRDRIMRDAGGSFDPGTMLRAFEDCDDEKMNEIRARVDAIVDDPATAEALKPWYRQLCKRPCFHDEYLQTYTRRDVHLVDTDGRGVDRIDETGVWVAGTHYQLDVLIFASGFEVGTAYARRSGFETTGRDGVTLSTAWAQGMRTLHGINILGFPNLFVIGISQAANLVSNITHNYVEQSRAITEVVTHARAVGAVEVEPTVEAEQAWIDLLVSNEGSVMGSPDCTPGYYNNEGRSMGPSERLSASRYSAGPVAYFAFMADWCSFGTFVGLDFRPPHQPERPPIRHPPV